MRGIQFGRTLVKEGDNTFVGRLIPLEMAEYSDLEMTVRYNLMERRWGIWFSTGVTGRISGTPAEVREGLEELQAYWIERD